MPLQDHFHPPLSLRRHWHAFHNSWATYLSAEINRLLPPGYFAEANVQFGIEIDVANCQAEPPLLTVPFTPATDRVEVQVYRDSGGPSLAGAIELVSPANKDRPENCDAFVVKCAAYLQEGIGLVIVDVVKERRANLHEALLERITPEPAPWKVPLYAVAYHPATAGEQTLLEMWPSELKLGQVLPTPVLCLRGGLRIPVELEATYMRTCREQRLPIESA